MNEISLILESKEKIFWEGKPVYFAYIISILMGGIIAGTIIGLIISQILKLSVIPGIGIGIIIFILSLIVGNLVYKVTHYAITNKRVIFQSGIIGRDFRSIEYDKIQNASVDVGLISWIFSVGDIKIFTGEIESVGGKYPKMQPKYDIIKYVQEPYNVLKILQTNLSQRKEKHH